MDVKTSLCSFALALGLTTCAEYQTGATGPSAVQRQDAATASNTKPPSAKLPNSRVRPPALAGSWYPERRALALLAAERLMRIAAAAPSVPTKPLVLVVPHAGWSLSGAAAAAAYRSLRPGDFKRVVVVGPAHTSNFAGFSINDWSGYQTPLGTVPLCSEARWVRDGESVSAVPNADLREHSIEIQLPLLQSRLGSFCVIPILAGTTTAAMEQRLAERLAQLNDGRTLYVFTSDFVHYGPRFAYTPYGPSARRARSKIHALEQRAIQLLVKGHAARFRTYVQTTGASICGHQSLAAMLELLPRVAPRPSAKLLSQYASSDLPGAAGDDRVGYASLAFAAGGQTPRAADAPPMGAPPPPQVCRVGSPPLDTAAGVALARLARAALETELKGTSALRQELALLPASRQLERVQAAFVTLKDGGRLRGCVGHIQPEYPLAEAVVRAALAAALDDSRFDAVTADEVSQLSVEVTALEPLRPVASWQHIELGRHGILFELDNRRALFLPQVPGQQGWTLEQTLTALARKAGLNHEAWRGSEAKFSVFGGQIFRAEATASSSGAEPTQLLQHAP